MRDSQKNLREQYIDSLFPIQNPIMQRSKQVAIDAGVGGVSMSSYEVGILSWMLKACRVEKMIEIGTLTGFSGLGLLQALPDHGQLWSFEKDLNRGELAQSFFDEALKGTTKKAQVLIGDAELELLKIEDQGPFDGIFIDGNKSAYGRYLAWAEKNLRPGGLILADNIFLSGTVYGEKNARFSDKQIRVMQEFNLRLCDSKYFDSCLIPTPEGLLVAIKKS